MGVYRMVDGKTYNLEQLSEAFEVIQAAMDVDGTGPGSYAHSWYSNIRMVFLDTIDASEGSLRLIPDEVKHRLTHDAACRFMRLCFNINITEK